MATIFWTAASAISAGTAYAPPAGVNAPRMVAVKSAVIVPATSGATTNPVEETGQVSGTTTPGTGTIALDVSQQKFISGDDIAAGGTVVIEIIADGGLPPTSQT